MEEEIDLREYLDVIIRRWKWIVAITLVAVITAAIISFLVIAPLYEARAGIMILKSESEITFEPKYRTLTDEELARAGMDIASRRKALEALVESNPVAAGVIAKLRATLEPEEQEVGRLLGMIKTNSRGDLIEIAVRSTDPKKAAAIANAWGEVYERYINELYSGRPQSPEQIQAQVVEARKTYEEAQEALARLMGDNRIESLSREIEAKQNALADYYAAKQGLDRLMGDAKALRDQLRKRPSSSTVSDLLTLLLQANAFMVSTSLPLQPSTSLPLQPSTSLPLQPSTSLPLQLQLSLGQMAGLEGSAEDQLGDLDTLISVLEARREEVQSLISEGSIQQEVLQLQEELEREEARKRELTQARDLAWETYQTLARKEAEVGVSAQVTDTEVRFAVPAVEPKKPVAPRNKLNVAMAGVLGLMVGVFGAFGIEYLSSPGRGKITEEKR